MAYARAGHWGPEIFLKKDGSPLTLASLLVYEAGTTTLATTWDDQLKTTETDGTFATDGDGNGSFYADPGEYDIAFLSLGDEKWRIRVSVPIDETDAVETVIFDGGAVANPVTFNDDVEFDGLVTLPDGGQAISATASNAAYPYAAGLVEVEKLRVGGDTDDEAIQRALDAATAGQTVVTEPGRTYTLEATLDLSVADVTVDFRWAKLKLDAGVANGTTMLRLNSTAPRAVVKNVRLDGSLVQGATGIRFKGSRQQVLNVVGFDVRAGVVYAETSDGWNVDNLLWLGNGWGVLTADAAVITDVTLNNIRGFAAGQTYGGDLIQFNLPTGSLDGFAITNVLASGIAKNGTNGMGIGMAHATNGTISNFAATGCALEALHFEDGCENISVVGLEVHDMPDARAAVSIQDGGGSSRPCKNITVDGFAISGVGTVARGTDVLGLEATGASSRIKFANGSVIGCGNATDANCYGVQMGSTSSGRVVNVTSDDHTAATIAAGFRMGASVGKWTLVGCGTTGSQYGLYSTALPATFSYSDCDFQATTTAVSVPGLGTSGSSNLTRDANESRGATTSTVVEQSRVDGESVTRFRRRANGNMFWGDGTASPDTSLLRSGADLLGMDTGDSFRVEGVYNGGTLRIGAWRLWDDGTNLRAKRGTPSSASDGTIVA